MSIYLFVKFEFPEPFLPEYGEKVHTLRKVIKEQDWISEVLAASGGIGGGPSSIWVFKLENYACLDKLFNGQDPVSKAYISFFRSMQDVEDVIREEIVFPDEEA